MPQELQPLIQLLAGKLGWLPMALGWVAASRLALKFFSDRIKERLTARMVATAESQDAQDGLDMEARLQARWYRTVAFWLDLLVSFKLPTRADFVRLVAEKKKGTQGTTVS